MFETQKDQNRLLVLAGRINRAWGFPWSSAELHEFVANDEVVSLWCDQPDAFWESARRLFSHNERARRFRDNSWGGFVPTRRTFLGNPQDWIPRVEEWRSLLDSISNKPRRPPREADEATPASIEDFRRLRKESGL